MWNGYRSGKDVDVARKNHGELGLGFQPPPLSCFMYQKRFKSSPEHACSLLLVRPLQRVDQPGGFYRGHQSCVILEFTAFWTLFFVGYTAPPTSGPFSAISDAEVKERAIRVTAVTRVLRAESLVYCLRVGELTTLMERFYASIGFGGSG